MTFRSRANPDQRRRRVLLEETLGDEPTSLVAPRAPRRGRTYPDDALGESQPRVTDFLPGNWRGVTAILLALVAADLAWAALAWFRGDLATRFPDAPLEPLRAEDPGSLARFCLASQCLLAAVLCPLLFAVRRRRLDDLRGTYRVWLWAAAIAGVLTLLCGDSIQTLVVYGLQQIPSLPVLPTPRAYLWVVLAGALVPFFIRLLIEMRHCRAAQLCLTAAALLAIGGEVMQHFASSSRMAEGIGPALTLMAATALCGSLLCYGRYVKLDAQGAFRQAKRKKKKKPVEEQEEASELDSTPSRARIDPAAPTPPRPNSIGAAITAARTSDIGGRGPLAKENRSRAGR